MVLPIGLPSLNKEFTYLLIQTERSTESLGLVPYIQTEWSEDPQLQNHENAFEMCHGIVVTVHAVPGVQYLLIRIEMFERYNLGK